MTSASESKLWYLSQINLFAAMLPEEMKQMEAMTSMCSTPKYEPIYLPGDPADSIYLLKKGRVRISRLSAEGKQIILSILEPGDIFGEVALIDDDSEQDSIAEAMEDTLLCIVRKTDFEQFLSMHPGLNLKVTKLIGLRLRQITNQMDALVFKSAEQRLKELLIRLSQEYPKPVADGTLINITLTHQELGELTNIARQTVTELLKRLENQGLIRFEKRRIVVLAALPHR
ncbi:MAG: Crp/Fnr family transcriptional regulator [Candidatus Sericytochromatia bacterium]